MKTTLVTPLALALAIGSWTAHAGSNTARAAFGTQAGLVVPIAYDEGTIRATVLNVQQSQNLLGTHLTAEVIAQGSAGGLARYTFAADLLTEPPQPPEEQGGPHGARLVFALRNRNGQTSLTTTLEGRRIRTDYRVGVDARAAEFHHDHLPRLLAAFAAGRTVYAGHQPLPPWEGPGYWAEYPLQTLGLQVLGALEGAGLSPIPSASLRGALALYAREMQHLQNDRGSEWEFWNTEFNPSKTHTPHEEPPKDQVGCIIPASAKAETVSAAGAAAGGTVSVEAFVVDVNVNTFPGGFLTPSSSLTPPTIAQVAYNCLAVDTEWGDEELVKYEATVAAESRITCTNCCRNGVTDSALTGSVNVKVSDFDFTFNGPNVKADALGGVASVSGSAYICYEDDDVWDDFVGAGGGNLKFKAELW